MVHLYMGIHTWYMSRFKNLVAKCCEWVLHRYVKTCENCCFDSCFHGVDFDMAKDRGLMGNYVEFDVRYFRGAFAGLSRNSGSFRKSPDWMSAFFEPPWTKNIPTIHFDCMLEAVKVWIQEPLIRGYAWFHFRVGFRDSVMKTTFAVLSRGFRGLGFYFRGGCLGEPLSKIITWGFLT